MRVFGTVSCDLDFDSPGKRADYVHISHSDDRHAFSSIRLSIGVIKGGKGLTVLLTAGNHGDEYEGQVVLHRLMAGLTPNDVPGRLIMLPALNLPAVLAGSRVSPLDGGNMNRAFPGAADAEPTKAIAGFVNRYLIGRADAVLDFHSGGTATEYVNCAFLGLGGDPLLDRQNFQLAELFGAPFTMVRYKNGGGADFDSAAYRKSIRFLSCELGGLGRYSPEAFLIGWDGCLRILKALGTIRADAFGRTADAGASCFLDIATGADFVTSEFYGIAAIYPAPGARVSAGDTLGHIYQIHRFGQNPAPVVAPRSGVIAIRRRNPLVRPGDHLCFISEEIPQDAVMQRAGKHPAQPTSHRRE